MSLAHGIWRWFDNHAVADLTVEEPETHPIDRLRTVPFHGLPMLTAPRLIWNLKTVPGRIAVGDCVAAMMS